MKQNCLLLLLFLFITLSSFSQRKVWRTTIYTTVEKLTGSLKQVNDTTLLLATKHGFETVPFSVIKSFRFVRIRDDGREYITGALVGSITGAVISVNALTKGKSGEPSAMAGVIGGIGGGLIGAITGALTAPFIYRLASAKKVIMIQSPGFYASLPLLLKPYIVL